MRRPDLSPGHWLGRLRRPFDAAVGWVRRPFARWSHPPDWIKLQRVDRRVLLAPLVIALVILFPVLTFYGPSVTQPAAAPTSAAPTAPSASPTPSEAVAATTPTPPAPTPEGTPAPRPSEPVDVGTSARVSPPPQATPTATPQAGLWRIQGYVVDENGNPLQNVCVVVGPRGCQPFSPHTDARGHYFLDVAETKPEASTMFSFFFEMPGRQTVWWQFIPSGPIEFNVVLKRT